MIIREAAPGDEANIVAHWRACDLVASYNDPAADFRFALSGESSTVMVADNGDGQLTGSLMVGHDGHRGWLYYLASAPGERGRGIGRALVEAGERWLRQRAVPKVQLMVRQTNRDVLPFYERLGYEDMPRILMSKCLDRPD